MATVEVEEARRFAAQLLRGLGLSEEQGTAVADILVEGDLLGHSTHGLAKLPGYVALIKSGGMVGDQSIVALADHGASFAWDANRLPGPWVVGLALRELQRRAANHAVVTATIADCSHIGCLQAYLRPVVEQGSLVLMMASDPGVRSVAPFGGLDAVLGPNPVAMGIPTRGDPILIDVSTATTSNASVRTAAEDGQRLPGPWMIDALGDPTDDPSVIYADPPGTILPLGGKDLGHKGFAFGIMVEAMALALSGHGRSNSKSPGGQGVFIQLINPAAFAGRERFLDEISAFADQVRSSQAISKSERLRLPGERALRGRKAQLETGLLLAESVVESLNGLAQECGVFPLRLSSTPGASAVSPTVVMVMGVSGAGKTTIGELLAQQVGVPFIDADSLHPASNIEKMKRGEPLTDTDRSPWLEEVGKALGDRRKHPDGVVVACSALRRQYRDLVRARAGQSLAIVCLDSDIETIRYRLGARKGHFMPAALLDSQYAALEKPFEEPDVILVDASASVAAIVDQASRLLKVHNRVSNGAELADSKMQGAEAASP